MATTKAAVKKIIPVLLLSILPESTTLHSFYHYPHHSHCLKLTCAIHFFELSYNGLNLTALGEWEIHMTFRGTTVLSRTLSNVLSKSLSANTTALKIRFQKDGIL